MRKLSLIGALSIAVLFFNTIAQAAMSLTPAGIADGFTLTNYASGGPFAYPYLGAAVLSDGTLVVVDNTTGLLNKYADVDGQTYGGALATNHSLGGFENAANAGGFAYASQYGGGIYKVDAALGLASVPLLPGIFTRYGLAGAPNGHLLASVFYSGTGAIADINPSDGSYSIIATDIPGSFFDGVSVSPDGTTVYAADYNGYRVLGYNIATHAMTFDSSVGGLLFGRPDGTAVITGGAFNGYIVANTNDDGVWLLSPDGLTQSKIADNTGRGDFVSPDLNNGTLLMSTYNEMWRLGITGGSIGGGAVPEPASLTLWALGAMGCAVARYQRRKMAA